MSPHFDDTLGALFLGHMFSMLLYGVTSLQTWIYFRRYPQDPLVLRSLVLFLWTIDCLHVVLVTHGVYIYLITHFGEAIMTLKPTWSLIMIPVVSSISNCIVRGTFAYRLWKSSGRAILIHIIIVTLSLCIVAFAIFFSVKGFFVSSWSQVHRYEWAIYAGFSSEMTVNIIITVAQIRLLRRFRTGVRFRSVDALLHTLIVYSINTCFVTSVCSILGLVLFSALPDGLLYYAFYFVVSKLYLNALLANLNARSSLQESLHHPQNSSAEPPTVIGTLSTVTNAGDKPPHDHLDQGCGDV
ncbi:hypothetical protein OBBRIDRAFT_359042 [Obba rivulosa]|uniref:DUF6534 domain-containing protein n=1 Tax=Obba rivulosa TaxID=1052685 RepID=A0A8E2DUR3_9APHY|nr:hypothetical protein OBBRIDRAFT_359042 [Obba rivulosa]